MEDPDQSGTIDIQTLDPAPVQLDPKVRAIVDQWWGTTTQTLGPLISVQAYNALSAARDNLIDLLTATLR